MLKVRGNHLMYVGAGLRWIRSRLGEIESRFAITTPSDDGDSPKTIYETAPETLSAEDFETRRIAANIAKLRASTARAIASETDCLPLHAAPYGSWSRM
jgi:hypothetical protein